MHFNPCIYGLSEMLESYGGVNVRHGTEFLDLVRSSARLPGARLRPSVRQSANPPKLASRPIDPPRTELPTR